MENQTAISIYLSNDKTKKYLTGEFITSLTSLDGSSKRLRNCDRNSLLACALKSTSMGNYLLTQIWVSLLFIFPLL